MESHNSSPSSGACRGTQTGGRRKVRGGAVILLVIGVLVTLSTVVAMNQSSGKFERFELATEAQQQQVQMLAEGILDVYGGIEVYTNGAGLNVYNLGAPLGTCGRPGYSGWFSESTLSNVNYYSGASLYNVQFVSPAPGLGFPLGPSNLSVDVQLFNSTMPFGTSPPVVHHAVWLGGLNWTPLPAGYPWPMTSGYFIRL